MCSDSKKQLLKRWKSSYSLIHVLKIRNTRFKQEVRLDIEINFLMAERENIKNMLWINLPRVTLAEAGQGKVQDRNPLVCSEE